MHVIIHQPSDPIGYFHEELTKLKKELDETNVMALILMWGNWALILSKLKSRCQNFKCGRDDRVYKEEINPLRGAMFLLEANHTRLNPVIYENVSNCGSRHNH